MRQFQFFLFILILGLAGPRAIEALQRFQPDGNFSAREAVMRVTQEQVAGPESATKTPDPYAKLSLRAKSAYVWDVDAHRKLYGQNDELQLPLASVAKIMMALVATESLPPETRVTVTAADVLGEGDTGLSVGEVWTLGRLLEFTLVASSNDGASAIAEATGAHFNGGVSRSAKENKKLFIEKMNERARGIGLTKTFFRNESGLDLSMGKSGAYGSARDMAMLFEYIFRRHPEIFIPTSASELTLRSENNIVHHIINTNKDVEHITGIIGSKTGYTDLAGGNLVVVIDIGVNHPVVIAVLGSTREDRFSDIRKLIVATTEAVTSEHL